MKVLFQSSNPNTFRSTLVGYLYEIAKKHRVVLMAGKLDSYTEKILGDKNLFPGLEKIIFFEAPFFGNIVRKNYRLCRLSKDIIKNYQPDIVIAPEDFWPMSLYLLRFAKKAGIATLALQDGFRIAEAKKLLLWSCLVNAHNKFPDFLPLPLRLFLVKVKKYLGHFFYYWVLPPSAGEMPFPGKTSFAFWDTSPGLRDADYSAVFSKRDYNLSIKDGVDKRKLFVLGHPLEHKTAKNFFEKAYFANNKIKKIGKIITVIWPDERLGFSGDDYSLIPEDKMKESRVKAVRLLSEKLGGWKIFIKPHPSEKRLSEIKNLFNLISNVTVADPSEPADKYIEISKVIVGFPLPSTTIFTAQKHHQDKIILYLNLNHEFLGDSYKDFNGIEYIDSEKDFINILNLIRNNKYHKKSGVVLNSSFSDVNELLDHLYTRHTNKQM